jgi:hypothetical protein
MKIAVKGAGLKANWLGLGVKNNGQFDWLCAGPEDILLSVCCYQAVAIMPLKIFLLMPFLKFRRHR